MRPDPERTRRTERRIVTIYAVLVFGGLAAAAAVFWWNALSL